MATNARTDVLIVTVTKIETNAVLEAFGVVRQGAQHSIDGRVYFDLGAVNGARVNMTRCEMGAGGLGASQQAIGKAIAALSPAAVIMVGIAFGVNDEKQNIGDVLVTEQLRPYDLQRVGTSDDQTVKVILRDDKPHASPWLLNLLKSSEVTWKGATLQFGTVLTGAKLVDNLDYRDMLRTFEPEAIGGEMEGTGLYVACHERKVDWVLVKAICDFADGQKSKDKTNRQTIAAKNAAAFVRHALQFVKVDWSKHHVTAAPVTDRTLSTPAKIALVGGLALVVTSTLFAWPLDLQHWFTAKPVNSSSTANTAIPLAGSASPSPSVTLFSQPFYDVPYGEAYYYSGNELRAARAYPAMPREMHRSGGVPLNRTDPSATKRAADAIREAYRIVLGNGPSQGPVLITALTLHQITYEPLPAKYVVLWGPKGLEQAITVNVQLKHDADNYPLLTNTEYIKLTPNDALPVIARIQDAEPGIYTLEARATVQSPAGSIETLKGSPFTLFVPAREESATARKNSKGALLIASAHKAPLAKRVLELSDTFYQDLVDHTNPDAWYLNDANSNEIRAALPLDDSALLEKLRGFAKIGDGKQGWNLQDTPGHDKDSRLGALATMRAESLRLRGQPAEAIRVLRDHLAESPGDASAYSDLMDLVLAHVDLASARDVWRLAQTAGIRGSEGYYLAGFALATALENEEMGAALADEAAMAVPDSFPCFKQRLRFWNQKGDNARVLLTVEKFAKYYDNLNRVMEQRECRRKFVAANLLVSSKDPALYVKWITRVFDRLPTDIVWDLRTQIDLWKFDDRLMWPATSVLANLSFSDRLRACSSMVAFARSSHMVSVAKSLFETRSSPLMREEEIQFFELLGDISATSSDDGAAKIVAKMYVSAIERLPDLKHPRAEALSIKAAIAALRARDRTLMAHVFHKVGPQSREVDDALRRELIAAGNDPEIINNLVGTFPNPSDLHDRAQGIVVLANGLEWSDRLTIYQGLQTWLAADGYDLPGYHISTNELRGLLEPLVGDTGSVPGASAKSKPSPRMLDAFMDLLFSVYTRQIELASIDSFLTATSRGDAGAIGADLRVAALEAHSSLSLSKVIDFAEKEALAPRSKGNAYVQFILAGAYAATRHFDAALSRAAQAGAIDPGWDAPASLTRQIKAITDATATPGLHANTPN